MNKIFQIIFLVFCVINFNANAADKPNATSKTVQEIEKIKDINIVGNQRVETSTIKSYLPFRNGSIFKESKLNDALKTLYKTGLFSEVNLSSKNGIVTVTVKENPIINKVIFEGNNSIKDENLAGELILKPRMVFSKSRVRDDTNRIIDIYNKTGRYATTVTPKIVKLKQNRINLVFDIHEGKKAQIAKIFFVGNTRFSDRKLKEAIMSKEAKFWNFFAKTDHYDSDLVENDKILLNRFYQSKGYINFKVISATADIEPSKNSFYITFSIDEGAQYDVRNLTVTSKIDAIKKESLKKLIQIKEGEVFNVLKIDDSIEEMIKYLSNKGFPFVQINPQYKINEDSKTVDITFDIGKAKRVYIGRINIKGNLKTYDDVIRREMKVSEGDPYNAFLIDRSKRKIEGLDFFEKINIDTVRTGKDDVIDLDISVEEKSTAQIKLSTGYSTSDGILGMVNFTESNFLGKGQYLNFGFQKSSVSNSVNFGFTEPRFLGNEMSAGFNTYYNSYDNKKASLGARSNSIPYKSSSLGLSLNMGYDIIDDLFHGLSYVIERSEISGLAADAPIYIRSQEGKYVNSMINQRFSYDKTDSPTFPTKGYVLKLNQSLAGIGGNTRYYRNIIAATKYFPIMEDVTFKVAGQGGQINSYSGKNVRINDHFYLGDQSFRGFQAAGIGPRDKASRDALGGQYYYTGTTELNFPIGLPKEMEVSGSVFGEAGSLWKVDIPKNLNYNSSQYYNEKALRASVGFGVLWITRMGPLRLDIAKAVKKQTYDKTQMVHFSFETRL
ncbi:MAG: outer membrane protein assembly factor BamA [Rickettsiales bacterium]